MLGDHAAKPQYARNQPTNRYQRYFPHHRQIISHSDTQSHRKTVSPEKIVTRLAAPHVRNGSKAEDRSGHRDGPLCAKSGRSVVSPDAITRILAGRWHNRSTRAAAESAGKHVAERTLIAYAELDLSGPPKSPAASRSAFLLLQTPLHPNETHEVGGSSP
jgi:hypothetical protein